MIGDLHLLLGGKPGPYLIHKPTPKASTAGQAIAGAHASATRKSNADTVETEEDRTF